MATKRNLVEGNPLLTETKRRLRKRAKDLPACRGTDDGIASFLFLPVDSGGRSIRLVEGRWETISLKKVILISPGSRVQDDVGGTGTVLEVHSDGDMRPVLLVRMDAGGERTLRADATRGA